MKRLIWTATLALVLPMQSGFGYEMLGKVMFARSSNTINGVVVEFRRHEGEQPFRTTTTSSGGNYSQGIDNEIATVHITYRDQNPGNPRFSAEARLAVANNTHPKSLDTVGLVDYTQGRLIAPEIDAPNAVEGAQRYFRASRDRETARRSVEMARRLDPQFEQHVQRVPNVAEFLRELDTPLR
jgi:hypothetical protein